KLLERTQARKEQLRKKNEEFNACRNKRNAPSVPSPAKPRRPLSEDNSDGGIPDDGSKRRIVSDSSVPKTPTRVTTTTPKVPTTRRPLSEDNSDGGIPDDGSKRRIVSDSSVPKTPTRVTTTTPKVPTTRRPLSEDNSDGGIPDDGSRRRIVSDSSVPKTPTRVTTTTPKVPTTRRPLSEDNSDGGIPDDGSRRRIVSDSSVPKTPTRVTTTPRVPTTPKATMVKLPHTDKVPTVPTAISKVKAGVDVDTSSPSIRARKEKLILMQQRDQESCIIPKKHWKKAVEMNPSDNKSPSVAARSAIFQTNEKTPGVSTITPGKLLSKRNMFENNSPALDSIDSNPKGLELSTAPPKPPRLAETEKTLHREKSSSKRKAPPPPTEASDVVVSKSRNESKDEKSHSYDYSVVSAKKSSEEVPAKRERKSEKAAVQERRVKTTVEVVMDAVPKPRKRIQIEESKVDSGFEMEDEKTRINLEEERAKRRQERKKARMENSEREEIVIANPQVVDASEDKKRRARDHPMRVEAVAVHVAEVSSPQRIIAPKPRTRVEVVTDSVDGKDTYTKKEEAPLQNNTLKTTELDCEPVLKQDKPVTNKYNNTANSSTTAEQEQQNVPRAKNPSSSRLLSTENLHRYGSLGDMYAGMDDALNESVNLNDVNIHEMTFTFDFSNFDKIQEDRESTFQKSFNETQQEIEKEKIKETKSNQPSNESDNIQMITSRPKPTINVDEKDMGVFKSGYSMGADDQYATKVYKKERPPVPERPKPTQEKIKDLLDQAALQQNIILQTSQALNVCQTNNDIFKGSQEEVEAERVLLLASERKQACLNEHHRVKTGRKESKRINHMDQKACTSTVSLSGIRLSLKQEFMDVLRVGIRHDLGVFHFVCHVQHGPLEITSTKTMSIHDCTGDSNCLTFPDKFVMKNLNPDFNIVVRVFGMHVQKYNHCTANTAQKHKFFQSPKGTKNKRRLPDGASPGGAESMPVFRTSNFKLVGSTRITLPLVHSKKWVLDGLVEGCPLKDNIHMKIDCLPQYSSCVKGFLTILEDVGGFSAWQRRWCVLEGGMLSYWRYPGEESEKGPLGTLDMGQCVSERITTVPRDLCARPNTIEVALKKDRNEDA
ncbi:hypothetical protein QZH41_012890, partial [Actinostola sp. cb2023]